MSSAQNAGLMQRTYSWLFAAAANLNDAVIGVEQETTLDSFSPNQPNILVDAHLEADTPSTIRYKFYIRRADGSQIFIGDQSTFRTSFPAQTRPQLPLGVRPGLFQLVAVQTAGVLTATTLLTTFQRGLSV